MKQDEIIKAVAQVAALPRSKRDLLVDSTRVKYGVMMTYPYFMITMDATQADLFFSFDSDEAERRKSELKVQNPLCDYEVFMLCKTMRYAT